MVEVYRYDCMLSRLRKCRLVLLRQMISLRRFSSCSHVLHITGGKLLISWRSLKGFCDSVALGMCLSVIVFRSHHIATHVSCSMVCVAVCMLGTTMGPAKSAEPTEMPFERHTDVGSRHHVFDGECLLALRIQLNNPCTAAMRPYVRLLWLVLLNMDMEGYCCLRTGVKCVSSVPSGVDWWIKKVWCQWLIIPGWR